MYLCYNALSHFSFYWVVFLAMDKLMPCSSIVNKATGQVCRPDEKNGWGKNYTTEIKKGNRLLQTRHVHTFHSQQYAG